MKRKRCLTEGCKRKVQQRGLCQACLQAARAKMQSGEFTDQQLVDLGVILPRFQAPFNIQLKKAIQKAQR